MKEHNDPQLETLTVPTVRLTHHQMQLKRVLISRHQTKEAKVRLNLQGVSHTMSKRRNIFTGTALAGALVIAVVAFSVVPPPKNVNAQELARNASQAVTSMNPSAQASDYNKFRPQFMKWLQQAEQAPDLQVLTYDQLVAAYPSAEETKPVNGEPLRIIDNPDDGQTPDVSKLRYLEFGIVDGTAKLKIIVGVNDQNIPEAAMTHIVEGGSGPAIR